jgi:hypothetical protein
MTDRTPAEIYDELFDAWVKQGPPARLLALIEAMRIDREGHTLQ